MITETKFPGIFHEKGKKTQLYTINFVKGKTVYGESLRKQKKTEFREWDASKSKLGAYIMKGGNQVALKPSHTVLYLGASTGTTVSHVSDIVGNQGFIFAVEFAPRVCRDLVFVAEDRKNIAPILADANQPDTYKDRIEKVDWLFMDIAQKNQPEIFLKNIQAFLKPKGYALLALKARSIDVAKRPGEIFQQVQRKLEEHLTLVDKRFLSPFQKDHVLFVFKKK